MIVICVSIMSKFMTKVPRNEKVIFFFHHFDFQKNQHLVMSQMAATPPLVQPAEVSYTIIQKFFIKEQVRVCSFKGFNGR